MKQKKNVYVHIDILFFSEADYGDQQWFQLNIWLNRQKVLPERDFRKVGDLVGAFKRTFEVHVLFYFVVQKLPWRLVIIVII